MHNQNFNQYSDLMARLSRIRVLNRVITKRSVGLNNEWSIINKKKRKNPLLSQELKVKMQQWIMKNNIVINSHITNDTLLVSDERTKKRMKRVGNVLLRYSISDLYNDLIKGINNGGLQGVYNDSKVEISETGLRFILPDQLKKYYTKVWTNVKMSNKYKPK